MIPVPWTDARVETLKSLWSRGLSAAQVAAALGGVSRNAVIGKLHRLGIANRGAPSAPRILAKRPAPSTGAPKRRRPAAAGRSVVRVISRSAAAPRQAPSVELTPTVRLLEALPAKGCRWPIGDPAKPSFGFCGRLRERGPYCAAHASSAYRGAPERLDCDPFVRRLLAGAAS